MHAITMNKKDVYEFKKCREWYMGGFKERKAKGETLYLITTSKIKSNNKKLGTKISGECSSSSKMLK